MESIIVWVMLITLYLFAEGNKMMYRELQRMNALADFVLEESDEHIQYANMSMEEVNAELTLSTGEYERQMAIYDEATKKQL
jgi:hypothetical protein